MASGDLDEYRIRDLVQAGAPIDAFGVGTQLATSADAPTMSATYKLVELDIHGIKRYTAKYSADKDSVPGAKQVFRDEHRDVIARSGECGTRRSPAAAGAARRPADRAAALDRAVAAARRGIDREACRPLCDNWRRRSRGRSSTAANCAS